jgi:hypothetical protein
VLACCPALPHLHELTDGVCCHGYGRRELLIEQYLFALWRVLLRRLAR